MFKVQTNDQTVSLSERQLLQTLIAKVAESPKDDHVTLAKTLIDYLSLAGSLSEMTPAQLATLAFSVGYFYRVFISKNIVKMEQNDETNSNTVSN